MARKVNSNNLLMLLSVTALLLSAGLANYLQVSDPKRVVSQGVLSESTENRNQEKVDIKEEDDKKMENSDEEIKIENKSETKQNENEFEQEYETASSDGTVTTFKLKVKSKIVNGRTVVETAAGQKEVQNSPEDIANTLVEDNVFENPISYDAKTNNNKVEFEFQGIDSKKLFGLFDINLPKTITVDSETGNVVSSDQSFWIKFLDMLSR